MSESFALVGGFPKKTQFTHIGLGKCNLPLCKSNAVTSHKEGQLTIKLCDHHHSLFHKFENKVKLQEYVRKLQEKWVGKEKPTKEKVIFN